MPKFIPYDYQQNSMVVINFADQIQPGTFEHAVHYLIDKKIDCTIFHDAYQNDVNGRPAYDPAILLKVILFAYSKGITSSRQIQWCCENNIIFKALSCDTVPHFTTIAHFISHAPQKIENVFAQVLLVCDQQGLLGHELFAIDGCKMSSDASKEWSGTFKELEKKRQKIKQHIQHHMKTHQALDRTDPENQQLQLRIEQTLETLNHAHNKIESFLNTQQKRMGHGRQKKEVKSNITDNESAKMTTSKGTIQGYNGIAAVDKKHQIIIEAQAFGAGQEHHTLKPLLEGIKTRYQQSFNQSNIYQTGIIVTADTGYANEANMHYLHKNNINAYIPDNQFRSRDPKFANQKTDYGKRHQNTKAKKKAALIPATEFQFDPVNKTCICPEGNQLSLRNQRLDQYGNQKIFFEGRLLQCRHCTIKHRCMENPKAADHRKGNGRQVSFILEKAKRQPTYTDWMKHRVDSQKGKQIYSHRMSVVEPVFGNIGTNKGLNRFSLRGKEKVQGQWRLYCLVHNIEKLANYGNLG